MRPCGMTSVALGVDVIDPRQQSRLRSDWRTPMCRPCRGARQPWPGTPSSTRDPPGVSRASTSRKARGPRGCRRTPVPVEQRMVRAREVRIPHRAHHIAGKRVERRERRRASDLSGSGCAPRRSRTCRARFAARRRRSRLRRGRAPRRRREEGTRVRSVDPSEPASRCAGRNPSGRDTGSRSRNRAGGPSISAPRCFSVPPSASGALCRIWSTWGRASSSLVSPRLEGREGHGEGVVLELATMRRPEPRISIPDRASSPLEAGVSIVAERHGAVVVHEGLILDQVPEPEPGRTEAEVDFFSVASAERLASNVAAHVECRTGDEHAEADPVITSGRRPIPLAAHERAALIDLWFRRVEPNASMTSAGTCRSIRSS